MKKILIPILLLLIFTPTVSFAAEIFFGVDKGSFAPNEDFLVRVLMNTEDLAVNAIGGTVLFPSELLELKEIRDGNSSINFWIEKPHDVENGQVAFSGIITGGLSGEKVFLFELVFHSKRSGRSLIRFGDIQVLQNDGLGTKISTKEIPLSLYISQSSDGLQFDLTIRDIDPPEDFKPIVGSDPSLFDGKYFIAFSTVDKGGGIDHYEIRERNFWSFWGEYVVAESPYLLKDQSLSKNLYIRAIDKSGNERTVKIKAQNSLLRFPVNLILGILLVICVFFLGKILSKFLKR
ncbi:hypothetical protein A3A95_04160 [Candidatus Nomurabacteria bacterium RIFCSPLOWO2_01_FULL_39_18]|uniref:Cohesin domain-containing protein n=1 Tax=Candidatus Nomurabacteria bacterium RIFCSPHIGHO2_01_FULL_40_24b TaxID=1801739 RepID=A0A1F6V6A2_9BACT|nr:MAG: hypothetical protein A2647_04360 [Candidatus Nomurabacteria bacterium RIFCSPHIGHO2_01_FULL_40_24b]OGI89293.1 MAG: hypothetical protein A3A95_04160 [Candidatus Nomurabacteria bacterium RIFCSPLOWO2_01_FULL_39_18]